MEERQLAGFIEPLRVAPGSQVRLGRDFDPAFKAGVAGKKDGRALLGEAVDLLAAQRTHGVGVPAGAGWRQGRHQPARDERGQPARREGE